MVKNLEETIKTDPKELLLGREHNFAIKSYKADDEDILESNRLVFNDRMYD